MRRILVPTDFSRPATHATDLALRLAQRNGAEVHLLHSVDAPAGWGEGGSVTAVTASKNVRAQQALYPEVRRQVGKATSRLEAITMDMGRRKVKATYDIGANLAWQDITGMSAKGTVDLIVMGTTGASGLKEALIGSNTQKVVRMASCPVITLRHAAPERIRDIGLLADPGEKGLAARLAALLAPVEVLKARLHLLYVNTPGLFQDTDTSLERMRAMAKLIEPEVKIHVTDHFSVAEGALAFARREGLDMLGVLTHGRVGLRGMLNPSVAEMVVNHSELPVLTLRMS